MPEIVVTHIRIYPIKACGGIEVAGARMEERGFQHDRRWMVMNDAGGYFDQLEHPPSGQRRPADHRGRAAPPGAGDGAAARAI